MHTVIFQVVAAGLCDLGDLQRLEQECFPLDAWPLLDLMAVLSLPWMVRFKAVDEQGQMLGFVAGERKPAQGVGWITTIGVFAAARRTGVGTALLLACEKAMQMPRVRLSVRASNYAALHLYEKQGYRQVNLWRDYYRGGEDGVVLEKEMFKND
jgi:ribosomal-protein-alanine N-acetyltransferase